MYFALELDLLFIVVGSVPFRESGFTSVCRGMRG